MFNIYQKDDGFSEPEDQIYYLLAANGLFLVKRAKFFDSTTMIFEPKASRQISWLKNHKGGVRLKLRKKIPQELIKQTLSFFKKVCHKYTGVEAIVLLYWVESTEEYKLVIPEQEVSAAALSYKVGKNPPDWLRIGTIHSHGHMQAFHSGVDDHDEEHDDGIHITIGNMGFMPSISCSVVVDGERQQLTYNQIVEGEESAEVPDEWMEKVKEKTFAYQSAGLITGKKTKKKKNDLFSSFKTPSRKKRR